MKVDRIPVVFATDYKFMFPTSVAIASMMENKDPDTCYLFYLLVTDGLLDSPVESLDVLQEIYKGIEIVCIGMDDSEFKDARIITPHLSLPAYYRLFISDILLEHDRCIYLDCDVLVLGDLKELYQMDLKDSYLAGVKNFGAQIKNEGNERHRELIGLPTMDQYIYSGMLVMDLHRLRKDHMAEMFAEHMVKGYPSEDQDVLNVCCYGHIMFLPLCYNLLNRYYGNTLSLLKGHIYADEELLEAKHPFILHFAGWNMKPWENIWCKGSGLWWRHAAHFKELPDYQTTLVAARDWGKNTDWENFLRRCQDRDDIIIFGASKVGEDVERWLMTAGIGTVRCFCDNDERKWRERSESGLPVLKLEEAISRWPNAFFINTSQIYYRLIRHQLLQAGVKEASILRYNHKSEIFYLALDSDAYEYELRQILIKEYGLDNRWRNMPFCDIIKELRGIGRAGGMRRLVERYWMDKWLLNVSEE